MKEVSEATTLAGPPLLAGRYAYVRELGRGATGRVLLVSDALADGAHRALKVVGPEEAGRLRWELDVLSGIAHPNLAGVHELLTLEAPVGGAFRLEAAAAVLVEEHAPGDGAARVADRLRDDPGLVAWVLSVGRAVASALSAIHAAGLVHGDVKPDNVVVGEDPSASRLIDLGLSRPPGNDGRVGGTPGFLAPEAWQGQRSVATDLYALGATLHHLLGGRAAVGETRSRSIAGLVSIALAEPRSADSLSAELPAALRRLVATLLSEEPTERPASAREVVTRIAALASDLSLPQAEALGGVADVEPTDAERAMALAALPLRGRDEAVSRLVALLSSAPLVVVSGPPGAGRTRVAREAVRRLQSLRAAAGEAVPTWSSAVGRLPSVLAAHDAVVLVEDADDLPLAEVEAARRAASVEGASLTVILERTAGSGVGEVEEVALGPLDRAEMGSLLSDALGGRVGDALLDAAVAVSGGLPGRLCRLLAEGIASGADPRRPEALRELGAGPARGAAVVPPRGRPLAELLALAGGALSSGEVAAVLGGADTAPGLSALLGAGVASIGRDGRLTLRPDVTRDLDAESTSADTARRRDLATALLASSLPPGARGFVLAALGRTEDAEPAFLEAALLLRGQGDPEAAVDLCRRAREALGREAVDLRVAAADALRARGRYAAGLSELEGAAGASAARLRAELLRLLGRPAEAREEAQRAADAAEEGGSRAAVRAIVARTLLDEGRLPEALEAAEGAVGLATTAADGAALARASEVAALAALYVGQPEAASEHAARAIEAARRQGDAAAEGRARAVTALLAAERGEIRTAALKHAQAFELLDRAGELHGAATSLVNLGLARLDAGEPGPAILALRDGARRLARLDRDKDLCRVLYNLGLAAVLVGDDDLAASAVRNGRRAAERCGDRSAEGYARILESEMALREGALGRAREASDAAATAVGEAGPREQAVVFARRAMLLASIGDAAGAEGALDEADRAAVQDGSDAARVEARVAAGRVALLRGDLPRAIAASTEGRGAAERVGTYEARLRTVLLCADVSEASGDAVSARQALSEARALLDAAAATLEPAARARLRAVAAYRKALSAVPTEEGSVGGGADDRWRRLAVVARRLTAERRVGRLYEEILDAAVDLLGAERGFLVLRAEDGSLRVRVARGLERRDLASEELRFSRSVAARAIDGGRIVSSVDAIADDRLDAAASVHALALRSIVAVPLRSRGQVTGAIYLDDRLRPGAFGSEDEALLGDLSDLASIALDGAERLRAERRQARRLAVLQRRLARTVDAQAIEIASLRRVTGDGGVAFPGIVAHSAEMRRTLEMAARVATSDVPVLILGESGTGKELVARAIHSQGARAGAPFVSENCGAIPEPLLESALFGHVRGAFTGADRARPGLFEAADGGTLFLDEIGEMSTAMQTKLLRAVQDGEIRAVGSESARHVDVRILAATHRDLEAMVASGEFREDLYYRLAVVRLRVPPLRERPDDVAPLVAHFVSKHAPGRDIEVERRALSRLVTFPWPGNVRQLENEVQRALVMAGDVIREEDLSDALREDGGSEAPDELDLKGQVQLLERRLIRRALDRVGGNQTKAAKMLGLSRYGLQKMMRRLDVDR